MSDTKSAGTDESVTEIAGDKHVQGTVRLYANDTKLLLVPIPTKDPNDPLRLPRWRKLMILCGMILYGTVGLTSIASVGALIPAYRAEYMNPQLVLFSLGFNFSTIQHYNASHSIPPGVSLPKGTTLHWTPPPGGYKTQSNLALLANMPSLFLGLSNFFSVPLSFALGRRPLLLSGMTLASAALIWAAMSRSFSQHLAARCLLGLGSGSIESLAVLVLYDVNFVHRRGLAIGAMWSCAGLSSYALTIMSSEISTAIGWRWLYGIYAILSSFSLVIGILFVPETRYPRPLMNIDGQLLETDAYGYVRSIGAIGEFKDTVDLPDNITIKQRTWLEELKPFMGPLTWKPCLDCYRDILRSVIIPNAAWAVVLNSIAVALSVSGILTYATPLLTWKNGGAWQSKNTGLATIAILPGAALSFIVAGWGLDVLSKRMAKKNGGVHEPEHRLLAIIIPVIGCFVGCLLFGITASDTAKYHWTIFLIGHCLMGFGFLSLNIVLSVYTVECYPRLAGPMLVMVSALRNCISFAINFKVIDFIDLKGYDGAFGTFAGLIAGVSLFAVPFYFWGKRIRKWSEGITGYPR